VSAERIILKECVLVCTKYTWVRIGTSGGFLWDIKMALIIFSTCKTINF